jgi:hypothetical protein
VDELPQLPMQGPLRTFVIVATVAVLALIAVLMLGLARRDWRTSLWACVPLLLLAVAVPLGSSSRALHLLATLAAVAVGARNGYTFAGVERWLSVVGALALFTSALLARGVFT